MEAKSPASPRAQFFMHWTLKRKLHFRVLAWDSKRVSLTRPRKTARAQGIRSSKAASTTTQWCPQFWVKEQELPKHRKVSTDCLECHCCRLILPLPESSPISSRVKRRVKTPIFHDENVGQHQDDFGESTSPMDTDEVDDPFLTPSKSLRNVRLSPRSEARHQTLNSSPAKAYSKIETPILNSGNSLCLCGKYPLLILCRKQGERPISDTQNPSTQRCTVKESACYTSPSSWAGG